MKHQTEGPIKVNKYELAFDIIENPENYTSEQLGAIFSDLETREIYNLLCKTDSAVKTARETDVDAEWKYFSKKHIKHQHRHFSWGGSRAASVAAIVCSSIVAVAAGIVLTVSVINHGTKQQIDNGYAPDSVYLAEPIGSLSTKTDTIAVDLTPLIFENESLESIMKMIATIYGVDVRFNNKEVAALHLYYKLDPSLPLDEVLSQLNTFEQINIKRNGKTLTIN